MLTPVWGYAGRRDAYPGISDTADIMRWGSSRRAAVVVRTEIAGGSMHMHTSSFQLKPSLLTMTTYLLGAELPSVLAESQ